MTDLQKQNKLNHITHAIWYWEQKLKGTVFTWDKGKYTNEFILDQINFFKKMK